LQPLEGWELTGSVFGFLEEAPAPSLDSSFVAFLLPLLALEEAGVPLPPLLGLVSSGLDGLLSTSGSSFIASFLFGASTGDASSSCWNKQRLIKIDIRPNTQKKKIYINRMGHLEVSCSI
jgi:hypothetical protein